MGQRTIIASRNCTGAECENIIPVYEAACNGSQPKLCWPCVQAKRRATNRRVAHELVVEMAAPADVRDPIFNITGEFQKRPPEWILRNWAAWRRDHRRAMV